MLRRKVPINNGDTPITPVSQQMAPEETPDMETGELSDPIVSTSAEEGIASEAPTEETSSSADDGAAAYITALQAELEEARAKADEAEKRAIYLQAEFQNFRRRKDEENVALQKFANREIIQGLLPVVDNFERALAAAEQTKNYDALIGGVSGTLRQLQTMLQKAGVTPIEAVGKEFDPNYHEAIGHTEESDAPANTVTEEVQRGYLMHDRVLRPTLVKVAQG